MGLGIWRLHLYLCTFLSVTMHTWEYAKPHMVKLKTHHCAERRNDSLLSYESADVFLMVPGVCYSQCLPHSLDALRVSPW